MQTSTGEHFKNATTNLNTLQMSRILLTTNYVLQITNYTQLTVHASTWNLTKLRPRSHSDKYESRLQLTSKCSANKITVFHITNNFTSRTSLAVNNSTMT